MRPGHLATVVLGSWINLGPASAAAEALSAEQWQQDLTAFAEQAPKVHKNLFHALAREQFEGAVQHLKDRVPALSRNQIIVELARIVAKIGDGHSYLSLLEPPISFHRYAIKLYEFPDGVYVVSADPQYKAVVGGRVVKIGHTSFAAAESAKRASGRSARAIETTLKCRESSAPAAVSINSLASPWWTAGRH